MVGGYVGNDIYREIFKEVTHNKFITKNVTSFFPSSLSNMAKYNSIHECSEVSREDINECI